MLIGDAFPRDGDIKQIVMSIGFIIAINNEMIFEHFCSSTSVEGNIECVGICFPHALSSKDQS